MYKERLLNLGISGDLKGFEYLNYAISIYEPPISIGSVYDATAHRFGTTYSRVERSIRHAITKTNDDLRNGEFIAKYKILWREKKGK